MLKNSPSLETCIAEAPTDVRRNLYRVKPHAVTACIIHNKILTRSISFRLLHYFITIYF